MTQEISKMERQESRTVRYFRKLTCTLFGLSAITISSPFVYMSISDLPYFIPKEVKIADALEIEKYEKRNELEKKLREIIEKEEPIFSIPEAIHNDYQNYLESSKSYRKVAEETKTKEIIKNYHSRKKIEGNIAVGVGFASIAFLLLGLGSIALEDT